MSDVFETKSQSFMEGLTQYLQDASEEQAKAKATAQGADRPLTDAERAERTRLVTWSLGGPQPWRQVTSALIFSLAAMGAARRQWVNYPTSIEELEALAELESDGRPKPEESYMIEWNAPIKSMGAPEVVEVSQADPIADSSLGPDEEVQAQDNVQAQVDAEREAEKRALRGQEIDARLAAIDQELQRLDDPND